MNETQARFSENLRELLRKKDKTQTALAEYMNVSTASVSKWYMGNAMPRMDKIEKIARFLNVSTADLLRRKAAEKSHIEGYNLYEIITKYHEYQRATLRNSTCVRNEKVLNKVCECLGNVPLERIDARYYMDALPKEHFNERLTRFKAFMRWAYRNDYVEDISFLGKLLRLPEGDDDRVRFLEREELMQLLDGMAVEKWRDVTFILALSGLRIGELQALTKASVCLSERFLSVEGTFDREAHEIAHRTKTEASRRDVYIQDELLPVIEKYMALPGTLLIELNYDAYRKYLAENSERILGKRIHPHVLRHTMTSLFAESGIPLDVISRRLGHSDSDITRRIYFHVTQRLKARDAEMIKGISITKEAP